MVATVDIAHAHKIAASVPDPELPFLTLEDLGILRDVVLEQDVVVAKLTPTYIGCPAVSVIEQDVLTALTSAGFNARVTRVVSPAWSTSWITDQGIEKLKRNGISPPEPTESTQPIKSGTEHSINVNSISAKKSSSQSADNIALFAQRSVVCPRCDSANTQKLSEFGSTPCKAQYRCNSCLEPFDHFKCH